MRGFRKQYWSLPKLSHFMAALLDLDNFHFINVDFVAAGGYY